MGIRFYCPNGHKLHVKAFQAGMRGICPYCGAKVLIPLHSTRPSTKELKARRAAEPARSGPEHERANSAAETKKAAGDSHLKESLGALADGTETREMLETPAMSEGQSPAADIEIRGPSLPEPGPLEELPSDFEEIQLSDAYSAGGEEASASQDEEQTVSDPLAEKDVVWYVRPPAGGQYGPAAPEVVRTWFAEGRVTPDSYVWREGWRDWKLARDVFPAMLLKVLPEVSIEEQLERRLKRPAARGFWGQSALIALIFIFIGVLSVLIWLFGLRSPS
ncbi:MAG: GYF domain-containing protein [Thermogutta sp.]